MLAARKYVALCFVFAPFRTRQSYKRGAKHGQAVHKRTGIPVTVCIFAGNSK